MMEKTGEVRPGKTPDTEQKLQGEKTAQAGSTQQTKQLDDDVTKRLSDAASK